MWQLTLRKFACDREMLNKLVPAVMVLTVSKFAIQSECCHFPSRMYYLAKKNLYSRDIHEIDPQCDHVISCNIDFDLQRELVTRRYHGVASMSNRSLI